MTQGPNPMTPPPEGMSRIPLSRGLFAIVDKEDEGWLSQWKWSANARRGGRGFNACRRVYKDGGQSLVYMHRVITECPDGLEVDHINGDPLDNRRENLRVCTHKTNTHGYLPPVGRSRYRGVSWHKSWKRWIVRIVVGKERLPLGGFTSQEEAARAFDRAVIKHRDSLAFTNFPREEYKDGQ